MDETSKRDRLRMTKRDGRITALKDHGFSAIDVAVNRLADYEDTGLAPEEIETLQKREQGLAEMLVNVSCGCAVSYSRLAELAQAEKDGRLVMLPCKTGDILWTYYNYPSRAVYSFKATDVSTLNGKTVLNTDILSVIPASDVGKTVFLTRAEAEAALEWWKGEQDE